MDRLTKAQRSKNMRAVKSSGSKIEQLLSKALWRKGYRYRKNNKTVFGKPDISFKSLKIAVFCDSEFWHGKNWVEKKNDLKSNVAFWHAKIEKNIARDVVVNERLRSEGWTVLRFWGKDIEKNLENCVALIEEEINKVRQKKD